MSNSNAIEAAGDSLIEQFKKAVEAEEAADPIRTVRVSVTEHVRETFEVEIDVPVDLDVNDEDNYSQLAALVEEARVQADDVARNIEVTEVVWDLVKGAGQ